MRPLFTPDPQQVYQRTLADLPWCGIPVYLLRVRVRKFFCDEVSCSQRIFAERLDEVAGVYARSTDRQREALQWIAFALGGEAGARLARELGLLVSPDTLLKHIRGAFRADAEEEEEEVRVLGIDDFGFNRGNAPGTILVDLERHSIVDLYCRGTLKRVYSALAQAAPRRGSGQSGAFQRLPGGHFQRRSRGDTGYYRPLAPTS